MRRFGIVIVIMFLVLAVYGGSAYIEATADVTGTLSQDQVTIGGELETIVLDPDVSVSGNYISSDDVTGDLVLMAKSLHSGKSVSETYEYDLSSDGSDNNFESMVVEDFGSSDFPVGEQTDLRVRAEFSHPDVQDSSWSETVTISNQIDKTNCQTIYDSNPDASSGMYTISPDGNDINVYCEMNSDGGWVRLQIQDSDGNQVVTNDHGGSYGFDNNCGTYDDVDDKYYEGTNELNWPRSTNTGTFTYDITYQSGSNDLSSSEEQRIRSLASQISGDTRSVSLTCDDDGHSKSGHEVTLVDGSGNEWSPTSDTDVDGSGYLGFWVHGTDESQNTFEAIDAGFTGSGPDSSRTLPSNHIVPDKMIADINSGGAVAWGYEDSYVLVKLGS